MFRVDIICETVYPRFQQKEIFIVKSQLNKLFLILRQFPVSDFFFLFSFVKINGNNLSSPAFHGDIIQYGVVGRKN